MEAVLLLMNALFLAYIVSTMFHVGLITSVDQVVGVFRNARWLAGAVLAGLVLVPLIGWGVAELFQLEGASFLALILVASSPGAPFAVALANIQRGDLVAGAATMAILAVFGSVTTAITVDLIVSRADIEAAGGGEIDVARLVLSIVLLQIVPFVAGMAMRHWVPDHADSWEPAANRVSSVTFALVMLAIVIGGVEQVIDLIGSRIIVAGLVAGLLWMIAGAVLSPGPASTRGTAALLAASRNAGPVLLVATASFEDVEGVIPAIIAVFIILLVSQLVVASYLGRRQREPGAPPT